MVNRNKQPSDPRLGEPPHFLGWFFFCVVMGVFFASVVSAILFLGGHPDPLERFVFYFVRLTPSMFIALVLAWNLWRLIVWLGISEVDSSSRD